jgi:hypothetical protein
MSLELIGDERYSVSKLKKKRFDDSKKGSYLCIEIGRTVKMYLK